MQKHYQLRVCTPNFGCDLAYWGKLINEKTKQGIEYCLPKYCDNCRAYDNRHPSASMITGQPSPSSPEDTLDMQTSQELHETDGVGDDYDYYHDYDVSMGAVGMATSIAEVEQVDWWSAAHLAVENQGTSHQVLQRYRFL